MGYWDILRFVDIEKTLGNFFYWLINIANSTNYEQFQLIKQKDLNHVRYHFSIHN